MPSSRSRGGDGHTHTRSRALLHGGSAGGGGGPLRTPRPAGAAHRTRRGFGAGRSLAGSAPAPAAAPAGGSLLPPLQRPVCSPPVVVPQLRACSPFAPQWQPPAAVCTSSPSLAYILTPRPRGPWGRVSVAPTGLPPPTLLLPPGPSGGSGARWCSRGCSRRPSRCRCCGQRGTAAEAGRDVLYVRPQKWP